MGTKRLNVEILPTNRTITCDDGTTINMDLFMMRFHGAVQALIDAGMVRANESFGFAMAKPCPSKEDQAFASITGAWDNPYEFVWYVGGWGPNKNQYIANAVRKMRASLREDEDTLDLRQDYPPSLFKDRVDTINEYGTFPWGDFPWSGAVIIQVFGMIYAGAVSGLHEIEDDIIAKMILGLLARMIAEHNDLITVD